MYATIYITSQKETYICRFLIDNHYAVEYNGQNSREILQDMHHTNRLTLIKEGKINA